MSKQLNLESHLKKKIAYGKVDFINLVSRMKQKRKIEGKRNLALGVAAVSALTVFSFIFTI